MEAPDSLVFDLDGTLWNTCEVCARGWNNCVERLGIEFRKIVARDVRRVAGKPHDACMRETFIGLSDEQLRALERETIVEDNLLVEREGGVLFEGVREGLIALARAHRLLIVSNCQSGYIELFLKHSGIGALFEDFECWGNTGRPKGENLRALIERNALARPWMIGDTQGDCDAARQNGVPFVFASYGFGSCDGAELTLAAFGDLQRALDVAL